MISALSRDYIWLTKISSLFSSRFCPTVRAASHGSMIGGFISGIIQVLKLEELFLARPLSSRNAIERMFCRLKDFRRIATI